jgi:hypothetical protein
MFTSILVLVFVDVDELISMLMLSSIWHRDVSMWMDIDRQEMHKRQRQAQKHGAIYLQDSNSDPLPTTTAITQ